MPMSMLLPHEVIHALATSNASQVFRSIMFGDLTSQEVANFWTHVKELEPWKEHEILHDQHQDLSNLIGVALHADGAEMFRDDECFVYSWSSCFASAGIETDVMLYRFPILFIAERHMQDPKATCFKGCGGFFFCL